MNRKIFGYICTYVLALLMCFEILFSSVSSVSADSGDDYLNYPYYFITTGEGFTNSFYFNPGSSNGRFVLIRKISRNEYYYTTFYINDNNKTVSNAPWVNYYYYYSSSQQGYYNTTSGFSNGVSESVVTNIPIYDLTQFDATSSSGITYNMIANAKPIKLDGPTMDNQEMGTDNGIFGSSKFDMSNFKYWLITNGDSNHQSGAETVNFSRYAINLSNDLVANGQYKDLVGSYYYDSSKDEVTLSLFYRNEGVLTPANDWYLLWGGHALWGYTSYIHTSKNYIHFGNASLTFGTRITSSNIVWYEADEESGSSSEGYRPIISDNDIIISPPSGTNLPSINGVDFNIGDFLKDNYMQGYISAIQGFMSFLPTWLWALLGTSFSIFLILAIYKFIKG